MFHIEVELVTFLCHHSYLYGFIRHAQLQMCKKIFIYKHAKDALKFCCRRSTWDFNAKFQDNTFLASLVWPLWSLGLYWIQRCGFPLILWTCITGGVRCLSILNVVFAIIFGLLALFLGSTLLTLGSSCSVPLFWCYEIASWGLVSLHGATAFFLRRKAALVLDESNFAGQNIGLEMLEANPLEVTLDVQRHVSEGFKSWMGSSYLSSDEEDEQTDDYQEAHLIRTNSNRQRVWLILSADFWIFYGSRNSILKGWRCQFYEIELVHYTEQGSWHDLYMC